MLVKRQHWIPSLQFGDAVGIDIPSSPEPVQFCAPLAELPIVTPAPGMPPYPSSVDILRIEGAVEFVPYAFALQDGPGFGFPFSLFVGLYLAVWDDNLGDYNELDPSISTDLATNWVYWATKSSYFPNIGESFQLTTISFSFGRLPTIRLALGQALMLAVNCVGQVTYNQSLFMTCNQRLLISKLYG